MTRLLQAALRIGADPNDDEDDRLRKALLLSVVLMLIPVAAVWGAIYWLFGEPLAAAVPWSYLVFALGGVLVLARTRSYRLFAVPQFAAYMLLPFTLMWVLGGFVSGSAVALWSWFTPLGARMVGHRRAATLLYVAFAIGLVVSALVRPNLAVTNSLPHGVVMAFFVLNAIGVGAITYALLDVSAGGREGTLASMRGIMKRYFSRDVADAILGDPSRQELGGEVAEVTILFADLGGYTTYAGTRTPREVVELLNASFGAAVPPILEEGGTPVQMPGDAVMAIFGAPRFLPDHALRAARAALAIRARGEALAELHPTWPRFRIGVNSGEALVGNIGSDEFRSFTAIGDATNMAQRFQALAEPGQVVVGPQTVELLRGACELVALGSVRVKGKPEPVEPSALLRLRES